MRTDLPTQPHACCSAQAHRDAAKVSNVVQKCRQVLAKPFAHVTGPPAHSNSAAPRSRKQGRLTSAHQSERSRGTRAAGAQAHRHAANVSKVVHNVRHCLQDLSRTSLGHLPSPNSAAPMSVGRSPTSAHQSERSCGTRAAGAQAHRHAANVSKVVQKCDIACKTFRARPRTNCPVRTVLPQCRWEDRQPVRTNLNAAVARVLQARRRTATLPKCQRWCKSATLLARPFAHVTGPAAQSEQRCPNVGGSSPRPVRTNLNAAVARVLQARRRTATLPKCQRWCKSATLLARPFAHVTGHLPIEQRCPNAVGRSPTQCAPDLNAAVARVLQARRRTATLPKCQKWCKSATLLARPFAHVTGPPAQSNSAAPTSVGRSPTKCAPI